MSIILEQVKSIDIIEAIELLTPFHSERTPSCQIYPQTNSFYCRSTGNSGSLIDFIMADKNMKFSEALKYIANAYGIQQEYSEFDKLQIAQAIEQKKIKDAARQKLEVSEKLAQQTKVINRVQQIYKLAKRNDGCDYLLRKGFKSDFNLDGILRNRIISDWENKNLKPEIITKYNNSLIVPMLFYKW